MNRSLGVITLIAICLTATLAASCYECFTTDPSDECAAFPTEPPQNFTNVSCVGSCFKKTVYNVTTDTSTAASYYAPQQQASSIATLENWSIGIVVFAAVVVLGLLATTVVIILKRARDESKIAQRMPTHENERNRQPRKHGEHGAAAAAARIQSSSLVVNDGTLDCGSAHQQAATSSEQRTLDGHDDDGSSAAAFDDAAASVLMSEDSCLPTGCHLVDEMPRHQGTGASRPAATGGGKKIVVAPQ